MKKRINKFYEFIKTIGSSKGFVITFSIICGVVAWLFVLDANNPVTERTIAVEMEFVNFEEPAEKNLTLVSELGIVSANIKISGREDIVNNVIPSDLRLTVDFAKVTEKGTSYITVDTPECEKLGVKIEDYYPKEIAVSYDTRAEIYLPVRVDYDNALLKSGYEFVSVTAEPDNVPISDFESALENLECICVDVSENGVDGSIDGDKTLRFIGRFKTKTGGDVTANFNTENITVQVDVAKRVPVKYTISGTPGEDHYFSETVVSSETVLVDGTNKELAELESIELGVIDLAGATEDVAVTFEISEVLKGSLYSVESQSITVTAKISQLVTKEFRLSPDGISYPGRDDMLYDYNIDFSDSRLDTAGNIIVKIKGKKEAVSEVTLSALRPTLDLTGKYGSYNLLPLDFTLPEGVTLEGEYLADVEIVTKPTPEPTVPPTDLPDDEPAGTDMPDSSETPAAEKETAVTG
jgi:YbbR domain-containing protein